jgi:UDP-GlcNAc:undecaprenyl-phosphate GlcNAc-1-phosphate transferase
VNWSILALLAFLISNLLSLLIARKFENKKLKINRIGGVAIISSFVIVFLFSRIVLTSEWQAILIGSIGILLFGLLDDFKNLSWKKQLFFQLFLAFILIWFGFEVNRVTFSGNELFSLAFWQINFFGKTFFLVSSFFIVVWSIVLINAVNWLDGSDGILSIAGILSLIAVFGVSLRPEVNQPALAIISLIAIGSLGGFLIYNFPKARIEAGTSGSYFVGFLLASLAIVAGTKISTTMVILILPVTDFIWVIIDRIKEGQSIFSKDNKKRHLHYRLMKKGFSSRQIFLIYTLFLSLALLISFFVINQTQKVLLLIAEFSMISVLIFKLSNKIDFKKMKFKKYLKKIFRNPIYFLILIVFFAVLVNFWQNQKKNFFVAEQIVQLGSTQLAVKVAETSEETYRGLSGIKSLPEKEGMLFLYDNLSFCPHVMRGMLIDLDFIFLKDGKIISIKKNISKDFEGVIQAENLCNQVLEINAGEAEKLGIMMGDEIVVSD